MFCGHTIGSIRDHMQLILCNIEIQQICQFLKESDRKKLINKVVKEDTLNGFFLVNKSLKL